MHDLKTATLPAVWVSAKLAPVIRHFRQLEFRAAHSAAQDAVFNDVDQDFVDKMGLFTVQTTVRQQGYLSDPSGSGT